MPQNVTTTTTTIRVTTTTNRANCTSIGINLVPPLCDSDNNTCKQTYFCSLHMCVYVCKYVCRYVFFFNKCMHFFKYSPPYDSHHPYNCNFKLCISLATIYIHTHMRAFTHTHTYTESPKILFWFV